MDIEIDKPTHAFDARLITRGRSSPLICVEVWLPIDCHEDARIRATGSDLEASGHLPPAEFCGELSSLVSEIDPLFPFRVEADDVHIRGISTTAGQKFQGIRFSVGHIGRLRLKRVLGPNAAADAVPGKSIAGLLFRLSPLSYGLPQSICTTDYLGNRTVEVRDVQTLKMHLSSGFAAFDLHRHWAWSEGRFKRAIASSFPVIELKNCSAFQWGQLEEVQRIGRDACLFLTLAARHLTVMHVMVATTDEHEMEEWIAPLNRQRATTEEAATGPLIDERDLMATSHVLRRVG